MTKGRWNRRWGAFALLPVMLVAACGSEPGSPKTAETYGGMAPQRAEMDATTPVVAREELASGESAGAGDEAAKAPPAATGMPAEKPAPPPPQPAPGAGTTPAPTASPFQDKRSPILIYKADFTMSVYEVQKSIDAVQGLAEKNGGYLSRRDDSSITIRVPAGAFQGVVTELTKLGDVLKRDVVSEDVTAEYRDLEVQLQNQLALRDRFAKLLEKAQKVEDALAIEKELGRVTEEIERIKGRLKLLNDLASYSTITVHFAARSDQQIQGGPFILPLPWLNQLGLPRLLSL